MTNIFKGKTTRDEVLTTDGEHTIDRFIVNDKIKEEMNGTFEYECTIAITDEAPRGLYELFVKGGIIKVDDEYGEEIFRIASVQKSSRYITVYARQITIEETLALWLTDVRPENQNGIGALQWIYSGAQGVKEISVSSNISNTSTAYYMDCNVYEAISSGDNAFLERWGGEIQRRQYNLTINNKIGRDNGVEIVSRKNLKGFNIKEDETVITGIKAKGFDGIGDKIIYSPLRNQYPRTYIKEFKYEDIRLKSEDFPEGYTSMDLAQAELSRRAELEFSKNNVDKIQAEYDIDFINLAQTEEYKDIQATEKVEIGDIVTVRIENFDIDIKVRCIAREYSPKSKRRITTTLSTKDIKVKPPQISDIVAELEQVQTEGFQGLGGYINSVLNSGFKDSYYISRPNEALWLDNPDINLAKNVVRINKGGIGFSQTGYYGNYEYGFTIDGKINASLIAVGVLTTVLIRSEDGSCSINLATGEVNFNKGRIKGRNSEWNLETGVFESIRSYTDRVYDTRISGGQIESDNYLIMSTTGDGVGIEKRFDTGSGYSMNSVYAYDWGVSVSAPFGHKIQLSSDTIVANGDFKVLGDKNCIQRTKHFGDIPFYSNEDTESLLTKTSIDEWHETVLNKNGEYKCAIKIPNYLRECINTEIDYIVWIDKKDFGDYYYNTYNGYFVVISDRPMRFRYKLEGRRKSFEHKGEKLLMV